MAKRTGELPKKCCCGGRGKVILTEDGYYKVKCMKCGKETLPARHPLDARRSWIFVSDDFDSKIYQKK